METIGNGITTVLGSAFGNVLFWPSVVVLLLALMFRGVFANLIERIAKIDKDGITLHDTDRQVAGAKGERPQETVDAAEDLLANFNNSSVLTDVENRINESIKKHNLKVGDSTIKLLVRNLATERIIVGFQEIYRVIFGSQIHLLRMLGALGNRMPKDKVDQYVQGVKERFPKLFTQDFGVAEYMNFLLSRNLIFEEKGAVGITEYGMEFLAWALKTGKPEKNF